MKITLFDIIVMTLTVFGEASICYDDEQIKVAWVILNRTERYGGKIVRVCLNPWNFLCWIKNKYLWRFIIECVFCGGKEWGYDWKEFVRCFKNCTEAIQNIEKGKRWGGLYYHDNSIQTPEAWRNFEVVEKTTHFTFYKEKERE